MAALFARDETDSTGVLVENYSKIRLNRRKTKTCDFWENGEKMRCYSNNSIKIGAIGRKNAPVFGKSGKKWDGFAKIVDSCKTTKRKKIYICIGMQRPASESRLLPPDWAMRKLRSGP